MRSANAKLVDSGDMSGNITSNPLNVEMMKNVSLQAVFTGSPVGSLKVQCSNDKGLVQPDASVNGLSNWTDIGGTTYSVSAAGNLVWSMSNVPHRWLRVVYTRTSGSGTLNITFQAKGE